MARLSSSMARVVSGRPAVRDPIVEQYNSGDGGLFAWATAGEQPEQTVRPVCSIYAQRYGSSQMMNLFAAAVGGVCRQFILTMRIVWSVVA